MDNLLKLGRFFFCRFHRGFRRSVHPLRPALPRTSACTSVDARWRSTRLFHRRPPRRSCDRHRCQWEAPFFRRARRFRVCFLRRISSQPPRVGDPAKWRRAHRRLRSSLDWRGCIRACRNSAHRGFPQASLGHRLAPVHSARPLAVRVFHAGFRRAALHVRRLHRDARDALDSRALVLGIFHRRRLHRHRALRRGR